MGETTAFIAGIWVGIAIAVILLGLFVLSPLSSDLYKCQNENQSQLDKSGCVIQEISQDCNSEKCFDSNGELVSEETNCSFPSNQPHCIKYNSCPDSTFLIARDNYYSSCGYFPADDFPEDIPKLSTITCKYDMNHSLCEWGSKDCSCILDMPNCDCWSDEPCAEELEE